METIKEAIRLAGGATHLARSIGVSQQAVHLWKSGKTQLLARHAAAVEDATSGKVTAYAIGKELDRMKELRVCPIHPHN
jgi:DNA-binding transcriptional regulator YdaS (Cro superfamily)